MGQILAHSFPGGPPDAVARVTDCPGHADQTLSDGDGTVLEATGRIGSGHPARYLWLQAGVDGAYLWEPLRDDPFRSSVTTGLTLLAGRPIRRATTIRHGGQLDVRGKPGKGSTYVFDRPSA